MRCDEFDIDNIRMTFNMTLCKPILHLLCFTNALRTKLPVFLDKSAVFLGYSGPPYYYWRFDEPLGKNEGNV